jgi:hypothetical protein
MPAGWSAGTARRIANDTEPPAGIVVATRAGWLIAFADAVRQAPAYFFEGS